MTKQTKGLCKYCGKEYTRTGMLRHLTACKEKAIRFEQAKEKMKYYELILYGKYDKDYWLIIKISENATLNDLDQFIRDIWVECCGHLSAFEIDDQRYEKMPDRDIYWGRSPKSMNYKLKNILQQGMDLNYEYDFGSTTELIISVKDYYEAPKEKEQITILSRNNAPVFICSVCEKNEAAWINTERYYDRMSFLCNECLEKIDEGEEIDVNPDYLLPICNSPRMGTCGYEGSQYYPDQFEPDKNE